jgi:tRNA pseudouridine13 synthase
MSLSELWASNAFHPPRGSGVPLGSGVLRTEPDDFVVEEELGFLPSGQGQHILLKVRKRDANTQWVARALGNLCRCRPMDVGYAGLKDRRAVAVQWFTVPKTPQPSLEDWASVRTPEFEVLEAHAHSRKLPRGALAGNRFVIRVRDVEASDSDIAARIELIGRRGVPNYFGPQRFGREGSNLVRVASVAGVAPDMSGVSNVPGETGVASASDASGLVGTRGVSGVRALRPQERGFVLSAARSVMFNAALAERVRDESWDRVEAGDLANLDGRGSIFPVLEMDEVLRERGMRLDIHPTGPMWGRGLPQTQGRVLEMETRVAAEFPAARSLVEEAGMEQERRSLRLAVRDLEWSREASSVVVVSFRLTKGSFATTVLRELFDTAGDGDEGGED